MAETLVIQLPADDSGDAAWISVDAMGAGTSAPEQGPLEQAAAGAAGKQLIVLLPSAAVLRLHSNLPLKGNAKILQALPFALEDQLAQDVDKLHFAIGERNAQGLLPVAVVEKDRLRYYLQQLETARLFPTLVYAESEAVTPMPATIVVWINDSELIIREPDGKSSVSDIEELETIMSLKFPTITDTSAATNNVLIYCSAEANDRHQGLWDSLRSRAQSLDIKLIGDKGIGKLAGAIISKPGINLLQGKFSVKIDLFSWWPFWRNAAILLLAAGIMSVFSDAALLFQLNQKEAQLDTAASRILTDIFPSAAGAADPWGQLQSRLQGGGNIAVGGPDFIDALIVLADALDKSSGIKVDALNFRSGIIDLRLEAPAVENLDTFRQAINDSGRFIANIQSANPAGNVIKGRVQVKAQGT